MRSPTVVVRQDVLASWLTVSGYSQSQLAQGLGISKGRVSQILTSLEEPSAHLIAKLIMLTRLPFERLFKVIHESAPLPSVKPGNRDKKQVERQISSHHDGRDASAQKSFDKVAQD